MPVTTGRSSYGPSREVPTRRLYESARDLQRPDTCLMEVLYQWNPIDSQSEDHQVRVDISKVSP